MRGTRGATRSRGQRLLYPPPSLDLRLAETKSLTDWVSGSNLITFSRASSGTTIDSTGALVTVAAGSPRFTHNPVTGESLGLLVEESRTNSIRNNTMAGAVAGTPGTLPTNWTATTPANGIARQIIGTGTENGISYIDFRFFGTNTLGSAFYMDIALDSGTITAAQGQAWTESIYVKLIAGTISGASFTSAPRITLYETPGFSLSASQTFSSATNAALSTQRFSVTRTVSDVSTTGVSPRVAWNIATGATVDFTIRIGLPQLEQGNGATSVISTTGTAVTRSADIASITGTNFSSWYNQSEGTIYSEFQSALSTTSATASFNDGTANNRVSQLVSSNSFLAARNTNGAGVVFTPATANAPGSGVNKAALAFTDSDVAISGNSGAVATATNLSMPIVTQLQIGSQLNGAFLNGTIRRLTYWPQRLPNNTLVAITR